MKIAAIYARVSSDKQREDKTIASQTAALIAFAESQGYSVPAELIFEDDGYSGASLVRPGLERVRDLAAEGHLDAVLVYAPDRLSRKYAYQVLLIEERARHGVETVFVKAPAMATPEDQLLLQFQGMIAEYERAQILERSRRGKRHRARQGQVSVLSGAPYGYRYVCKTDEAAAYYEIIEAEADVVRRVYERYTVHHMSIGAITRLLNERGVPTRKRCGRWERSSVWAMLRNPAYKGTACFGKTRVAPRQRITRPLRLQGGIAARNSANHERPREEWIEIPVPAIVSDETFALAEERLERNKIHAPRRTIMPSIVQGLVSCSKCGYALSRTSTRSSARTIHYYRCLGSDAWRHLGGPVCDNRPVRQDLLDQVVWAEIIKLLETPSLIQEELDRRLAAARTSDPTQRRQKALQRDLARLRKSMDRLLTAYQEDLISLDELRRRCGSGSRPPTPSCSRSSTRPATAPPICAWPKPWPGSSPGYAHRRGPSTFTSGSGSSGSWSRRFWSATTRSLFATRFRSRPVHRPMIIPRPHPPAACPPANVAFCVQGVLSPLLANVLLDEVDKELERRGHCFVRYADDANVYVRSRKAGERVMALLRRLYGRLRLSVNETKSAVASVFGRKFLGYAFWVAPGGAIKRKVAAKPIAAFKQRIRQLTRRSGGRSLPDVVERLRSYVLGWKAYFRLAQTPRVWKDLDQWMRHRLRAVQLKQWKRGKTMHRELLALGAKPDVARRVAANSRRWWRNSGMLLNAVLTLEWSNKLGMPRLS